MDHVLNTKQMPWVPLSGPGFSGCKQRGDVIADDYTDAYSADVVQVAPGGKFTAPVEHGRCLVSVLSGVGRAVLAGEDMLVRTGAVIKVSVGMANKLENAGEETLVFLAIYDPPRKGWAE